MACIGGKAVRNLEEAQLDQRFGAFPSPESWRRDAEEFRVAERTETATVLSMLPSSGSHRRLVAFDVAPAELVVSQ